MEVKTRVKIGRTYTLKELEKFSTQKCKDWVRVFTSPFDEKIRRYEVKHNEVAFEKLSERIKTCAYRFLQKGLPFCLEREKIGTKIRVYIPAHQCYKVIEKKLNNFVLYVRKEDVDYAYYGKVNKNLRYTHKVLMEMKSLELCGKPLQYWLDKNHITINTIRSRLNTGWTFGQAIFTPKGGNTEWHLKRSNKKDLDKFVNHANARKFKW